MIGAALALARRGLRVFPCRPRAKEPATVNGLKAATTDPILIKCWWQQEPQSNIAIATGMASHVFVLDVDGAEAELKKLEAQHGAIPPTVEVITARGRHLYFKWPDRLVRNSAGKIAPGIDVRGEGGYVLAPPSVHPSGRRYEWSVDTANVIAPAPDWLLAKIAEPTTGAAVTPPSEWRELIKGVSEGARDCSTAKLAGHLLRRGVHSFVVLELLQSWNATRCTPPLPEKAIARIVNSIAGRELQRRGAS
jgi:hypothetical protein